MSGVDEQKPHKKAAQMIPPGLAAAAGSLAPVLAVVASQFKRAVQEAQKALESFVTSAWSYQQRPPAKKPCAWCGKARQRPATHTVKWRELVVFWDEHDEPIVWQPGRVMRMCEYHAKTAQRYNGVQAYRFRRIR